MENHPTLWLTWLLQRNDQTSKRLKNNITLMSKGNHGEALLFSVVSSSWYLRMHTEWKLLIVDHNSTENVYQSLPMRAICGSGQGYKNSYRCPRGPSTGLRVIHNSSVVSIVMNRSEVYPVRIENIMRYSLPLRMFCGRRSSSWWFAGKAHRTLLWEYIEHKQLRLWRMKVPSRNRYIHR